MSDHIHEAAIFAENVRRELRALPAEVVADLTDGLEADIASSLDDGATLPTASEYATDLMRGAGLESASTGRVGNTFARRLYGKVLPLWNRLNSWTTGLAPAWWVLRAWVVTQILGWWMSERDEARPFILQWGEMPVAGFLVFVVALIISVRWGRSTQTRWKYATYASHIVLIGATLGLLFGQPQGDRWASWAPPGGNGYSDIPNCALVPRVIGLQVAEAQQVLGEQGFEADFVGIADLALLPPNVVVAAQSPEGDNENCQSRVQLFFDQSLTTTTLSTVVPEPTTTISSIPKAIATTTVAPKATTTTRP